MEWRTILQARMGEDITVQVNLSGGEPTLADMRRLIALLTLMDWLPEAPTDERVMQQLEAARSLIFGAARTTGET